MKVKKRHQKRKAGKVFEEERCAQAHESQKRKSELRCRLRVAQYQRQVEKQEEKLRKFDVRPQSPPKPKKKGPEGWVLRGAARPAALLARIAAGECDQNGNEIKIPIYQDYYAKFEKGRFWEHEDCREYLRMLKDLGGACHKAESSSRAIEHFQKCIELDPLDHINARESLVSVLVDEGRAGEAREVMDRFDGSSSAVFAYSKLLIEYVAHYVLKEQDSSEKIVDAAFEKAFEMNPFIAKFISGYDTFSQVVEYVEDIVNAQSGSIEESFVYCANNAGVWMDTKGLQEWITEKLKKIDEPECCEGTYSDEMYLGMYQTAIEMMNEDEPLEEDACE